ncbi:thiamine pyrophosphate-binding protein [soil metagenome]
MMAGRDQTGGQLVCAALATAGCEVMFSVSGNQILPVYDAAGDAGLRIIHMRHESAAAYAAAAYAEIAGGIGVVLTSAGPGFLAALQGVAAARTMELPVLLLSGDSPVSQRGKGAFQELDQSTVAGAVCKATFSIDQASKIPAVIARAHRTATAGIPGPVHVSLPGDVLSSAAQPAEVEQPHEMPPLTAEERSIVDAMAEHISIAQRPLILARPSAARGVAGEHLGALARSLGIEPVVIEAPRGLADLKNASISSHFVESDCVLVLAPADFALGFLAPDTVAQDGTILLVDTEGDPAAERDLALHLRADLPSVLERLRSTTGFSGQVDPDWARLWPLPEPPGPERRQDNSIHPLAVSEAVRAAIRPDDIIVLDGGEFCQWIRLGLRDLPNPALWNGKIGAIGGGIPMAVGAAVAAGPSGRRVISIMGDGAAGYHLSEFETMDRYGLPVTIIIGNDARWAAEWHLQIARYGPDRTFETELTNARYDRVAAGFEASGEHITDADDLPGAIQEALGRQSPTCINVEVAALPSPAAMS